MVRLFQCLAWAMPLTLAAALAGATPAGMSLSVFTRPFYVDLPKADAIDPRLAADVAAFRNDLSAAGASATSRTLVVRVADPGELSGRRLGSCAVVAVTGDFDEPLASIATVLVHPCAVRETFLRRWIVYHELGHCLLNLDHVDSKNGIMAPNVDANALDQSPWSEAVRGLLTMVAR